MGEIKKPSYCLPDTPSVMDKSIHLAQEWEKLEGRRTQDQPLPPASEVSQQVRDSACGLQKGCCLISTLSPPTESLLWLMMTGHLQGRELWETWFPSSS